MSMFRNTTKFRLNVPFGIYRRAFSQNTVRSSANPLRIGVFSKTGLFATSLFGGFCYLNINSLNAVKNDEMLEATPDIRLQPRKKLTRKLNYDELSYGSLFGLFLGIVIGKLSFVLSVIGLTTFLSIEFLESKGIVSIPWRRVISLGGEKVELKSLFFDNPSFKIAFFLSFVIAAWNV